VAPRTSPTGRAPHAISGSRGDPVETGTAAEGARPGLRASGREAGSNRDRCRGTFVHEVQNGTIKHGSVRNDGLAPEGRDLKRRCK
jgi:hypothetical protein